MPDLDLPSLIGSDSWAFIRRDSLWDRVSREIAQAIVDTGFNRVPGVTNVKNYWLRRITQQGIPLDHPRVRKLWWLQIVYLLVVYNAGPGVSDMVKRVMLKED